MPKRLPELRFYCRVLTPTFLFGINNKQSNNQPELREESVIGLLRYWYRAVRSQQDVNQLREIEGDLFGSSEQRCAFDVLIKPTALNRATSPSFIVAKQDLIPGKAGSTQLNAISRDTTFCICFTFRRNYAVYQVQLEALLLLTSYLGGLGRRSRRGMGSFRIMFIERLTDTNEPILEIAKFENKVSFLHFVNNLLELIVPGDFTLNLSERTIERKVKIRPFKYPTIERISLLPDPTTTEAIYLATHELQQEMGHDGVYGEAMGRVNKRYASPMYTTLVEISNELYPLVTELSSPDSFNNQIHQQIREVFRNKL